MPSTAGQGPSEQVLQMLAPRFEADGYHRLAKKPIFSHSNGLFDRSFEVIVDGRGGLVGLEAGFFLRRPTWQKLLQSKLNVTTAWVAGGTLLNARCPTWKVWLNEDRFAAMTPTQRKAFSAEEIYPADRLQYAADVLWQGFQSTAKPFFDRLSDLAGLQAFYQEYIDAGWTGLLRPPQPYVVLLLSMLLAHELKQPFSPWQARVPEVAARSPGIAVADHVAQLCAALG
jgi:hypothetical protein